MIDDPPSARLLPPISLTVTAASVRTGLFNSLVIATSSPTPFPRTDPEVEPVDLGLYHSEMSVDVEQLQLVYYPHPVLRKKAKAIEAVTDEVRRVAHRMIQIMRDAPGVGLAAPQVGLDWRLFVARPPESDRDEVFINPVLTRPSSDLCDYEEGCLSLPNITASIRRPRAITIEALDLQGQPFRKTDDEFPARIWQHEFDHLEGVLILDRMTEIDQMANKRAIRDLERSFQG